MSGAAAYIPAATPSPTFAAPLNPNLKASTGPKNPVPPPPPPPPPPACEVIKLASGFPCLNCHEKLKFPRLDGIILPPEDGCEVGNLALSEPRFIVVEP